MAVLLWDGICKFFGKIFSCFKKALSIYSSLKNFILRILRIHQESVSSAVVSSPQQPQHHQQQQVSITIQDGHILLTTGSQHVNVRTIISLSTINSWILSSPSSSTENIFQQLVLNGAHRRSSSCTSRSSLYFNPVPVSSRVIAAHAIPEVDSGLASSSSSSSSSSPSSSLLLPSSSPSSSSSCQGLQFGVIVVDEFDLGWLEAATAQDKKGIIEKGLQFGSIIVEEFEEFQNSSLEKRKRKARRGHRGGRQYQARKRREQWKLDTMNARCTTDNIPMVLLIIIYFLFLCLKLFR